MKEALDFYISLFFHENVAVRVGAYAATLATLSFLITFIFKPIYSALKRSTSKIKVKSTIHQTLIKELNIFGNNITSGDPLFTAIITNSGSVPKYIRSISVKTSRMIDGFNEFAAPNFNGAFPVRLEPGQQLKHDFSIGALNRDVFSKLSPSDKVRFLVYDTSDKKYYSEKVKVKRLTTQLGVAHSLNSRR